MTEPVTNGASAAGADDGAPSARRTGGPARWLPLLLTTAVVLVGDQVSKAIAFDQLCERASGYDCLVHAQPVDLVWTLRLNLAFNTGMAFSKGAGAGPIIGLIVVAIVVVLLLIARRLTSRLQIVLVGVVIGGALGNLIDRLVRAQDGFLSGAVVDFIDLRWWPIFNVADAAVVVGAIALALTGLSTDGSHHDRAPAPEPHDDAPADDAPADDAPADDAAEDPSAVGRPPA